MKVRIFESQWSGQLHQMEKDINDFLASNEVRSVRFVTNASSATRTGPSDQRMSRGGTAETEESCVVMIWYDERS